MESNKVDSSGNFADQLALVLRVHLQIAAERAARRKQLSARQLFDRVEIRSARTEIAMKVFSPSPLFNLVLRSIAFCSGTRQNNSMAKTHTQLRQGFMSTSRTLSALLCLFAFSQLSGASQEATHHIPSVVTVKVDPSQRSALAHSVRPELRRAIDQGRTDSGRQLTSMMFSFARTPAQEAELQQLLEAQQNPGSANYHKWLTPVEYGERFGASPRDIEKVVEWLGASDFLNLHVANGKDFVTFDGSVATAEATLGIEIHNYLVNGEGHFANSANVLIPAAFAHLIKDVSGLNDFYPKPLNVQRLGNVSPAYGVGSSAHYLVAQDIQKIYDITPLYANYRGTGQRIVVVGAYELKPDDASVQSYRALNGFPPKNLETHGASSSSTQDVVDEAYLDVEVASAVAPDATIVYAINANTTQAAIDAIDNNLGDILSMRFTKCEAAAVSPPPDVENSRQKATSQGMTIISSSGDTGAAGEGSGTRCDGPHQASATHGLSVNYPASSPNVTAIGGTTLDESPLGDGY